MIPSRALVIALCLSVLAASAGLLPAQHTAPATTASLTPLSSDAPCHGCFGYLLQGTHVPSSRTRWRVDSDLPEIYRSNGVLYTTHNVLPPFNTADGDEVPLSMRTQRNIGFEGIDQSVEIFLYHLLDRVEEGETRRIVVLAENITQAPVRIRSRETILYGPNAARPDSVESELGRRVLEDRWEAPIAPAIIPPGEMRVIAYTKRMGASADGDDQVRDRFITGIVEAHLEAVAPEDPQAPATETRPLVQITVVSVPGEELRDLPSLRHVARQWLDRGAESGERWMDLRIPPPRCHVRRVVGTARNVRWQNTPLTIDTAALTAEGIAFPMALPAAQSVGCWSARQTIDLALHPSYVHPDSVGNYMMEYHLVFNLVNTSSEAQLADIRFGKTDQKIGLAYQIATGPNPTNLPSIARQPAIIAWAGKGSADMQEPAWATSFFTEGPPRLQPGESLTVGIRLMVLGTSSLPWQLYLAASPAP